MMIEKKFLLSKKDFIPAYLKLYEKNKNLLKEKIEQGYALLKECKVCPRKCGINRLDNKSAFCRTGRYPKVSSYFLHQGEEKCLRGWKGSGTIFFAFCNLRCVFCQNYDISWQGKNAVELKPEELAKIMIYLQKKGAHNINFVTPEHVAPQVIESVIVAIELGLNIPIVYNTSAYDSEDSLMLANDIVDIYMPDFKLWDPDLSGQLLYARDYSQSARWSIKIMNCQVGPLKFDEDGIAVRGVLVRHLIMPNYIDQSKKILEFIAREVSVDTYLNIMTQYYPAGRIVFLPHKYPQLIRGITYEEYNTVMRYAKALGLYRFDI
ncbi:MAG: radical SAM protein [Planctomycetota bacterium]